MLVFDVYENLKGTNNNKAFLKLIILHCSFSYALSRLQENKI